MIIGGLEKISLLDYPGHLAAVIFTQGCNFRCHFCYNPMLVWPLSESDKSEYKERGQSLILEVDLFSFLASRQGKLDAVVISGGEPTLYSDLPEFISKIKDLGFLVKLDTNGTNPEMLKKLLDRNLLDYIAMDIKGHQQNYEKVVSQPVDFKKIEKSVKIVMASNLPYEFRTTLVPSLHTKEDIKLMGEIIRGAVAWNLQSFKSTIDLVDPEFKNQKAFTEADMKEMRKIALQFVNKCIIR
jgi:pyruvate formate lyase activating enzyme